MERKWENFIALGLVVIFFNVTLKGCAIKEKIDKLDFIRIWNVYIKRHKKTPMEWEEIFVNHKW